jgi:hypothetical protein
MNLDLQARVKNVGLHLELMDDHMYTYSNENQADFWSTKELPLALEGDIDMGKKDILEKENIF